eukprot:TRINITY_DN41943_c0_g2_i1.p1 TRINITY_DN41943_c0_g2~~TRINITY_DN41943_c0_g2_i1.p1  ORF type:complete len:134 (+),score=13.63 TRINITY_DN41943_c0_g2_i1:139-540(+)
MSFPASPQRTSSPVKPVIQSALVVPESVSAPLVPMIVAMVCPPISQDVAPGPGGSGAFPMLHFPRMPTPDGDRFFFFFFFFLKCEGNGLGPFQSIVAGGGRVGICCYNFCFFLVFGFLFLLNCPPRRGHGGRH